MPANHCVPHTAEAKARMSAARKGKPSPWRRRSSRVVDGVVQWQCGRCRDFFPAGGFYRNGRTLLGLKSECKACHSRASISSRDLNLARESKRHSERRRRARRAGCSTVATRRDARYVVVLLGNRCTRCGSRKALQIDHVYPLARGGTDHPLNFQPLCPSCNNRKHARATDFRTEAQKLMLARAFWVVEFKVLEKARAAA